MWSWSHWGRADWGVGESTAQFRYPVSQQFPIDIGHVTERPPVVCDLLDDVEYVWKSVSNQLQLDTPTFWAEVGEAVS